MLNIGFSLLLLMGAQAQVPFTPADYFNPEKYLVNPVTISGYLYPAGFLFLLWMKKFRW